MNKEQLYNFTEWYSARYQRFHDKFIKLKGNGSFEDPYTTEQPFVSWEDLYKEWLDESASTQPSTGINLTKMQDKFWASNI